MNGFKDGLRRNKNQEDDVIICEDPDLGMDLHSNVIITDHHNNKLAPKQRQDQERKENTVNIYDVPNNNTKMNIYDVPNSNMKMNSMNNYDVPNTNRNKNTLTPKQRHDQSRRLTPISLYDNVPNTNYHDNNLFSPTTTR